MSLVTFLIGSAPVVGYNNVEDKCSIWMIKLGQVEEYNFKNWNTFKKNIVNNEELKTKLINHFKKNKT